MRQIFTYKDFESFPVTNEGHQCIASIANERINEIIESWPVVYQKRTLGDPYALIWAEYETDESAIAYKATNYKARLAFIEEIKKEPCKHEPKFVEVNLLQGKWHAATTECKHCGVELEPTWSEKK